MASQAHSLREKLFGNGEQTLIAEPSVGPCTGTGPCFWAFRPDGADGWAGCWHVTRTDGGWWITGPIDRHGRRVDEEIEVRDPSAAAAGLLPYLKPQLVGLIERERVIERLASPQQRLSSPEQRRIA